MLVEIILFVYIVVTNLQCGSCPQKDFVPIFFMMIVDTYCLIIFLFDMCAVVRLILSRFQYICINSWHFVRRLFQHSFVIQCVCGCVFVLRVVYFVSLTIVVFVMKSQSLYELMVVQVIGSCLAVNIVLYNFVKANYATTENRNAPVGIETDV